MQESFIKDIKLIIWDLDGTLWKGILAETDVLEVKVQFAKMVKLLSERGIINSVASKNDLLSTRKTLQRIGLWDEFVLPQINYEPKSRQVREIIEKLQFRPVNVLFIDDSINNLNEVKHYLPEINCINPDAAHTERLLNQILLSAKPDPGGVRLKQYKVLEQKVEKRSYFTSNEEFLRESKIEVSLIPRPLPYLDRILDLVTRTNQLNFTKSRDEGHYLVMTISDQTRKSYAVHVKDRFGDHGIVGFVQYDDNNVYHFLFSCRIMNMGIEDFVHDYLKIPDFDPAEPVAHKLRSSQPDWIELANNSPLMPKENYTPEILLVGTCTSAQMLCHLDRKDYVETYLAQRSKTQAQLWKHMHVRLDSIDFLTYQFSPEQYELLWNTQPFFDRETVLSRPDFSDFKVIIYSSSVDSCWPTYVNEKIPGFYLHGGDLSNAEDPDKELKPIEQNFLQLWQEKGKTPEVLEKQIKELYRLMTNGDRHLIHILQLGKFIAGCESAEFHSELVVEQKIYNDIAVKAARFNSHVHLVQVDEFVFKSDDVHPDPRHYPRRIVSLIGEAVNRLVNRILES
jgi:FkbH-like protein